MNNKGFSLVELMVVVGIIGILALVAGPQYSRFRARAKTSQAKSELAGVYMAEQTFNTEFGSYTASLPLAGFVPDGVPMVAGDCPSNARGGATGIQTQRYYSVGFVAAGGVAGGGIGIPADPCAGGTVVFSYPNTVGANLAVNAQAVVNAAGTTFTAHATGNVGLSAVDDWQINELKVMDNSAP